MIKEHLFGQDAEQSTCEWKNAGEDSDEVTLTPRKTDVTVTHFGLAWAPCWEVAGPGGLVDIKPAYRL